MTDNTQKLDEILFNLCDLSYASFATQEEADRVADQLDYDRQEAKQAILDWHNKQIEELLIHISEYAENVASEDENGEFRMKAIPLSLIAVEINKLKERDDDQL